VTINVGVIGTGNIGTDHVNKLTYQVSGAAVSAVFDVDNERAKALAETVGARVLDTATDVIASDAVDAELIASPGHLHTDQVLACIDAGKPVLCEKPLATTSVDALKVVEAEAASRRQLVQIGFMRRYDSGYLQVKGALDSGQIGEALVLHCVHRNPTVPESFQAEMAITDSVVHEIDTSRWLLSEEIVAVTIRAGKKSPHAPSQDPQLVLFETESGVLVDVESFVNCQYGYDVRCELVGSEGLASLDNPTLSAVTTSAARSTLVPGDWRVRFTAAYLTELQTWVNTLATGGEFGGADAWDGYAATAVAEAGLRALAEGTRVPVELVDKPSFYSGGEPV
jgi:myo-inositol 2-dehydrogenase/D-chiro-inositol 1-dehydrogenase